MAEAEQNGHQAAPEDGVLHDPPAVKRRPNRLERLMQDVSWGKEFRSRRTLTSAVAGYTDEAEGKKAKVEAKEAVVLEEERRERARKHRVNEVQLKKRSGHVKLSALHPSYPSVDAFSSCATYTLFVRSAFMSTLERLAKEAVEQEAVEQANAEREEAESVSAGKKRARAPEESGTARKRQKVTHTPSGTSKEPAAAKGRRRAQGGEESSKTSTGRRGKGGAADAEAGTSHGRGVSKSATKREEKKKVNKKAQVKTKEKKGKTAEKEDEVNGTGRPSQSGVGTKRKAPAKKAKVSKVETDEEALARYLGQMTAAQRGMVEQLEGMGFECGDVVRTLHATRFSVRMALSRLLAQ